MRVLMALPRLAKGGAEKLTCDIAIEMQKRPGVQVKVVSFDMEDTYPQLTSQLDMEWIPSKVQLSLSGKNRFQLEGYKHLLEVYQPNIIHSHLFEAEIISRSVVYPKAKYFSHCHDNMRQFEPLHAATLFSKKKLTEFYERQYLFRQYRKNGGNHFIAISKDNYRYFNRVLPTDLRNVTLLHNAINFSSYNAACIPRNTSTIHIVNTGRFVATKNQAFLLEILHELRQKGVSVFLTFLGDGPELETVKQKAAEYGLLDSINFAGSVERVEEYLKKANIYIHTAVHEAFGLVLLEAMSAGLPVIALDGKGNRDLVKDGENGYFIETQDATLFAEKIIALMSNTPLYNTISKQAVEFAKEYDIKNYIDRLLKLYSAS